MLLGNPGGSLSRADRGLPDRSAFATAWRSGVFMTSIPSGAGGGQNGRGPERAAFWLGIVPLNTSKLREPREPRRMNYPLEEWFD